MPFRGFQSVLCLSILVACGGGSGEAPFSVAPANNGLPFASDGDTLDDFAGEVGEVTVIGHYLDYETGTPVIIVERARLQIDAFQGDGPLVNVDPDMTISFNGETLVFVDGTAVDKDGKTWSAYIDTTGTVSGTAGIYHYDYGVGTDAFDTEAVFAFGFLTDPTEVTARSAKARYSGDWFGYGLVTNGSREILQNEAIGGGTLILTADFDTDRVSGSISGSYDAFGRVDGAVAPVAWNGNGFSSSIGLECGSDQTCGSNTIVGGAFFGAGASEISGSIGFDARRTTTTSTRRLVSSAGYTLVEEPQGN